MRKLVRRSAAAKAPRKAKTPARRKLAKPAAEAELREAAHLESISRSYERSELAWQRMTAPPEGDETWSAVEEQLARSRGAQDQERRWKYFSK